MKNNTPHALAPNSHSDNEIRDYAYHLYEQSNRLSGHDLANWLEAKACLEARIPAQASHMRLQHYIATHEHGTISHELHPESDPVRSPLHPLDWLRSSFHHA